MQRTVAQISWRSNIAILDTLKDSNQRLWYVQKTIENGLSRDILVLQIKSRLHERIGQTTNNFDITLPSMDSDMAGRIFKDPYVFDFLGTATPRREAELDRRGHVSIHAPAGGATMQLAAIEAAKQVSIHAPAGGATVGFNKVNPFNQFQSTLPQGERP